MSGEKKLNERGNYDGQFSQGIGGWAEFKVYMTDLGDKIRYDLAAPPSKVIPIIFIPGVMGSNLRLSKKAQNDLKRTDNRAWRPDDLQSAKLRTAANLGFGGTFRDATPAERQKIFDPNETEVEYYHYTESKGRFDPEGKETRESDLRHQNVPDNMEMVPPLMVYADAISNREHNRVWAYPAQLARWRGWSEVLFDGAYSTMLRSTELCMNNIVEKSLFDPRCVWRPQENSLFNHSSGVKLAEAELRKIAKCWYPVHAMGYNFLKSNADSAKVISERIKGLVKGYKNCGFSCSEVIIVTHSMGGLVGRAIIHPEYGNMLNDPDVKILGIYHGAMPTVGAAATYKRIRFGFLEHDSFEDKVFAEIVAKNGEHATAILANTSAPLEMLPASGYGYNWLRVIDAGRNTLFSWPKEGENALESIYLQPPDKWWRLINPTWVNPANRTARDGGGIDAVMKRLRAATAFLDSIENTFHPTQSYASFCASEEHKCFGNIVFKVMNPECYADEIPSPENWSLISEDKLGTLKVQAGKRVLELKLQPGQEPGDETVPSTRSASKARGIIFKHGIEKKQGYEHQDSYSHPNVLASMLYSIVRIAGTAKWD